MPLVSAGVWFDAFTPPTVIPKRRNLSFSTEPPAEPTIAALMAAYRGWDGAVATPKPPPRRLAPAPEFTAPILAQPDAFTFTVALLQQPLPVRRPPVRQLADATTWFDVQGWPLLVSWMPAPLGRKAPPANRRLEPTAILPPAAIPDDRGILGALQATWPTPRRQPQRQFAESQASPPPVATLDLPFLLGWHVPQTPRKAFRPSPTARLLPELVIGPPSTNAAVQLAWNVPMRPVRLPALPRRLEPMRSVWFGTLQVDVLMAWQQPQAVAPGKPFRRLPAASVQVITLLPAMGDGRAWYVQTPARRWLQRPVASFDVFCCPPLKTPLGLSGGTSATDEATEGWRHWIV